MGSRVALGFVAVFVCLAMLTVWAWPKRRLLTVRAVGLFVDPPPLGEAAPEPPSVAWFDDYFTVEHIDPDTIAIGEPRYWQQNYSYLVLGERRAILFDAGTGVRDIVGVVESLTDLPVTVVPSHFHYDHVGNLARFERVALPDLPHVRARTESGTFRPSPGEHLGFAEGFDLPDWSVTEWWPPGSEVDLGGRSLQVLHAPGHTPESIALLDRERRLLFVGDYLYEGPLFVMLPGSDLGDYLATARHLLEVAPPGTRLLAGHRATPPGAPILELTDLADLHRALEGVAAGHLAGEGFYVESYPVNERLSLLAEAAWARGSR